MIDSVRIPFFFIVLQVFVTQQLSLRVPLVVASMLHGYVMVHLIVLMEVTKKTAPAQRINLRVQMANCVYLQILRVITSTTVRITVMKSMLIVYVILPLNLNVMEEDV